MSALSVNSWRKVSIIRHFQIPLCKPNVSGSGVALKNLTERGNLFEESMKNLRHLAWTVKDRKDEPQLDLLREQNSVLKQVIKNLKRKVGISDSYFN